MREETVIGKKIHRICWAILIVLLCFGTYAIYDRKARTEEIKKSSALSRSMLNARGRIQIILLNANLEGRRLNASEIDEIKQLWSKAEYDQAITEKTPQN